PPHNRRPALLQPRTPPRPHPRRPRHPRPRRLLRPRRPHRRPPGGGRDPDRLRRDHLPAGLRGPRPPHGRPRRPRLPPRAPPHLVLPLPGRRIALRPPPATPRPRHHPLTMKLLACLLLPALLACSSDSKNTAPADTHSPPAATGEGQPCTQEVELVCPDGQIDACSKALAEPDTTPDAGDTGTM